MGENTDDRRQLGRSLEWGGEMTQPGAQKWQEVEVLGKRVPDAACAAGSKRSSPYEGDMLQGSVVRGVYRTDNLRRMLCFRVKGHGCILN